MSLPALRLALFPFWPGWKAVQRGLAAQLRDRVIVLPAELPMAEREEVIDALALLLGWPVYEYGDPAAKAAQERGQSCVVLVLQGDSPPEPLPGQVVLAVVKRAVGEGLRLPHELLLLRDAVTESLGRRFSGQPELALVSWLPEVTDSPSTALRFMNGALAARRAAGETSEAELYCAGLAAVVAFLLRGVDVRVAQWVVALACGAIDPARLVGTEAALLGQDEALESALGAGLAYEVPHKGAGRLRWRWPIAALGSLERAPGKLGLEDVARKLAAQIHPEVSAVLDRLTELRRPLGLTFPDPPGDFVGREEELHRLERWLVPGTEVRTCALVGPSGMGKSALAALLCQRQRERFEPVWLSFASGPESAWARVASRLRVPLGASELQERTASGIPRWVTLVHERLRERRCLIVVDDADRVPLDALSAWLPGGAGACAVLVLCRLTPGPLVRQREALVFSLRGLSASEKDKLLCLRSPKAAALPVADRERLLQRLPDSPQSVLVLTLLCEQISPAEVAKMLDGGQQGPPLGLVEALPQELRTAIQGLPAEIRRLLEVLGVCAEWTLIDLVDAMLAPEGDLGTGEVNVIVQNQMEVLRSLGVEANGVLLRGEPLVANLLLSVLGAEGYQRLEVAHIRKVLALWNRALNRQDEVLKELLYDDLRLAASRLARSLDNGKSVLLELALPIINFLWNYQRGDRHDVRQRLLRLCEAGLARATEMSERYFIKRLTYWKYSILLDREELTNTTVLEQAERDLRAAVDSISAGNAALLFELGHAMMLLAEAGNPHKLDEAMQIVGAAAATQTAGSSEWHITHQGVVAILLKMAQDNPAIARKAIHGCEVLLRSFDTAPEPLTPLLVRDYERFLARALLLVHGDDRGPCLQRGIEVLRRSLASTSREFEPYMWASTQIIYAKLLLAQVQLGTVEPQLLADAVLRLRAALSHFDELSAPSDWADAQRTLGQALLRLPAGDQRENLQHAIAAFQAALRVCEAGSSARLTEELRQLLADAERRHALLSQPDAAPAVG